MGEKEYSESESILTKSEEPMKEGSKRKISERRKSAPRENEKDNQDFQNNGNDKDDEDNDDDNDNDNDNDDDDEDDKNYKVEMRILPDRSSRGRRYTQLLGEEAERDTQFWGHNTWEEEECDSEWSSIDQDEESEESSSESSQSEDNVDEEFVEVEDEDDGLSYKDSSRRNKAIYRGKYKDPSLFSKSMQKDLLKRQNKAKKKVKNTSSNKPKEFQIEKRSMSIRESTARKKQDLQEEMRRRDEEALERARLRKKKRNHDESNRLPKEMTQEERLVQSKIVEKMNTESLSYLEACEEHKRYLDNTSASVRKQFQSGSLNIYISWSSYRLMESEKDKANSILSENEYCREMLLYTDGIIPEVLNQHRCSKNKKEAICSIFGTKARYLDPLTNKYYSNFEAFKIIRKDYHVMKYKEFLKELKDLNDLVYKKKQELTNIHELT
ncbi:hypothetical protein ACR3K2_34860 [Cryptosporidium serpentis]